ncbi:MAG: hypothetical protein ACI81R_001547 [Bradymonadia bacterium]|jgi:hypothetical protein
MNRVASLLLVVSSLLALANCDTTSPPAAAEVESLVPGPAADPSLALAAIQPALPSATSDQTATMERILADAEGFFAGDPSSRVLNETEMVFFETGRTLELADLYLAQVQREGTSAETRPRLAWLYQRIGERRLALTHAEQAFEERPTDPNAVFVLGFVVGQSETGGNEVIRRVVELYSRTLQLDPNYIGPGGVTPEDINAQLERMRPN